MVCEPNRSQRSWRRVLRFSVRVLVVFVIVVGAGLGWIVRQAHIQRDAVAAIRKAGGYVSYSWASDHGKAIPERRPWAPTWLVESIGIDFFGHVTAVELEGSSVPAYTVLTQVGRLNRLQKLWLIGNFVTDAGLVHLKRLTKLDWLDLGGTGVNDVGLEHLKGLTNLKSLSLRDTRVTDAGMDELKRALPGLTIYR
jgi:internalin A